MRRSLRNLLGSLSVGALLCLSWFTPLTAQSPEDEDKYTIGVTVDSGLTGVLTNMATVTAMTNEANPGDESAIEDTTVTSQADLVIAMSDSAETVIAGQRLTYTVTVTNNGPSDARYVEVADTVPAGVIFQSTTGCDEDPRGVPTCSLGTVPAGSWKRFAVTVTVKPDTLGRITNQASVSSQTTEIKPGDESTSEDTLVDGRADLAITKTDSVDPVVAGTALTYTVTVANNGPSDAREVRVNDTLPEGVSFQATSGCTEDGGPGGGVPTCSLGTIPAGSSKSYTIDVMVDPDVTGGITNRASVSSATIEAKPGDESVAESTGDPDEPDER